MNSLKRFLKNTQIPNLREIHSVEGKLFHVSWWTDRQTWKS